MKLSIIIPVYNCVAYVEECVKSIYNCSIPEIELEMLLVDDGSTDGSGALLDVLAEKYAKVMRVFHTPNQGVSVARNLALDHATGEWLMFVDADDLLQPDTLQCLYHEAQFYRYDVTRFGACLFGGGKKVRKYKRCKNFSQDLGEFRNMVMANDVMHGVWGGIYRKALFDTNDICFKPGLKYGEDWLVLFKALCYAQTFRYYDEALYGYRINPASAMHKQHKHIKRDGYQVFLLLQEYAKEANISIHARSIEHQRARLCINAMRFALTMRSSEAYREAEHVMGKYCHLPYRRIYRHCSPKQVLGVSAYWLTKHFKL